MKTGTRVTFIPGIPALYAEALKNVCYVKGIPLVRALHPMMGVDKETGEDRQARLYELTSQTSIPTMLHDDERPRNVWIEQLALAERIGAPGTPKLIPDDFEQRAEVFGLCAVVLGEDGLVWNMRILSDSPLAQKYGYSEEASAAAPGKVAEVLQAHRSAVLQLRSRSGSRYLVGDSGDRGRCLLGDDEHVCWFHRQRSCRSLSRTRGMLKYFAKNGRSRSSPRRSPRIV